MPANPIAINLLGQEDLAHSPQGRLVKWALTYGRYIMIGTEIVVLLAFISRFSLDRKLTDLKEEIGQKQEILEANTPFENDFRNTQDHLAKIKTLVSSQSEPVDMLKLLSSLMPPDVYLNSLEISNEKITADVIAGTTLGFSQFIGGLQASKNISRVELGDVKKDPLNGIAFKFTATLALKKQK